MVVPSIVNPQVLTEQRPWGLFERYSLNEPTTVKLIMVEANKRLSLQYYNNRDEFWKVIKVLVEVRTEDNTRILETGESILIPRKTVHRLGALDEPAIVLEISYGQFDEQTLYALKTITRGYPTIPHRVVSSSKLDCDRPKVCSDRSEF
jgi:mannose-6-phosphate isomerase